jgi:hypothetical protein
LRDPHPSGAASEFSISRLIGRLSITWQLTLLFLIAIALMSSGTATTLYLRNQVELNAKETQITAINDAGYTIADFSMSPRLRKAS